MSDFDKDINVPTNDTISRQAAIDALGEEPEVWMGKDEYAQGLNNQWHYDINALKAVPSAQPERKRGKWMFSSDHAEGICTICQYKIYGRPYQGNYLIVPYNFCPNCGAAMRQQEDDIPMEYFENGGTV